MVEPVTVTLDAPESITQDRLLDWLADIGIDARNQPVQRVLIERGGVSVDVLAADLSGRRFVIGSTDDDRRVATHTIVIPITE